MKLAMFSPLNPQRSGVSDYTEELLPYLAQRAEVHLFIDDYQPTTRATVERFRILSYRAFPEWDDREQYDLVFYQMGNSPAHHYCYPLLGRYPGVVVLHDLVLHHMIAGLTVAQDNTWGYVREMSFAYGDRGEDLARRVASGEQEAPFFRYPLSDRAIRSSLGVIGHSEHVVGWVRRRHPEVPAALAPMGIPLPPVPRDLGALRERLGLARDTFVVASFGEASPHKRLVEALQAFAVLHRNHPQTQYVIVGNRAAALDLDKLVASLGIAGAVRVTGYVTRQEFDDYLQAADMCVNLRYPSAGETSASALRCMAVGKPVLVSDVDANRELPDDACLKAPVGEGEHEALVTALERLFDDQQARRALGERARSHVAAHHTLEQAADAYLRFTQDILAGAAIFSSEDGRPAGGGLVREVAAEMAALGVKATDRGLVSDLSRALRETGLRQDD